MITAHDHGNCELCDELEARTERFAQSCRVLVEQWRLEELREHEDFPDEARKLARCMHQLHAVIESW